MKSLLCFLLFIVGVFSETLTNELKMVTLTAGKRAFDLDDFPLYNYASREKTFSVSAEFKTMRPFQVSVKVDFKSLPKANSPNPFLSTYSTMFPMSPIEGSNKFSVDIILDSLRFREPLSGFYLLTLLVGDEQLSPSMSTFDLGTLLFAFPQSVALLNTAVMAADGVTPLKASPMASKFIPLAEVVKVHIPEEVDTVSSFKKAIGVFFSVIVGVPSLLLLRVLFSRLQLNSQEWRGKGASGILFWGGCVSTLTVLGLFFTKLNFVQTVMMIAAPLLVTVLSAASYFPQLSIH